jgi:hypothetical protein
MADMNKYWLGHYKAYVPDTMNEAKWSRGESSANKRAMLNGAFETYYVLKRAIDDCPDAEMKTSMSVELSSAGTAGFYSGTGVTSLDEAFQHWLKPGPWTDNNERTYMRAHGMFGAQNPAIVGTKYCWGLPTNSMPGPEFAVHFFDSLDSKMADLSGSIRNHNAEVANLAAAINAKEAQKTKNALSSIAKIAKAASKLMFLAPKPNDSFLTDVITGGTGTAFGGTAGNASGSFTRSVDLNAPSPLSGSPTRPGPGMNPSVTVVGATFLQTVMDIDTFLSVHSGMMKTGIFDNKTSTEFAVLAVALGKVPILGGFYAEVVKALPGFFAGMQNMFQEHYRNIDRQTRAN